MASTRGYAAHIEQVQQVEQRQARKASMPRQQRPLYIPAGESSPFWPEDSAGWLLVKMFAALDLSLVGFLVYLVVSR